jgi:AcrR family transcriptional regulator
VALVHNVLLTTPAAVQNATLERNTFIYTFEYVCVSISVNVVLVKSISLFARGDWVPRLTRTEQREETRRRLIESAGKVFARVGFEAAPIDVIAEEAGFSRGAFYSNFNSKDEVFLILLKEHLDAEIETLGRTMQRIDKPEDLAPAIERRYQVLGKEGSWCLLSTEFQLYAMRGGAMAGDFTRIYEKYRVRFGQLIDEHCARLGIKLSMSSYEFGVTQIALAHGLALQRAANRQIDGSLAARALALLWKTAKSR